MSRCPKCAGTRVDPYAPPEEPGKPCSLCAGAGSVPDAQEGLDLTKVGPLEAMPIGRTVIP